MCSSVEYPRGSNRASGKDEERLRIRALGPPSMSGGLEEGLHRREVHGGEFLFSLMQVGHVSQDSMLGEGHAPGKPLAEVVFLRNGHCGMESSSTPVKGMLPPTVIILTQGQQSIYKHM